MLGGQLSTINLPFPVEYSFFADNKKLGTDEGRTRDLRFTRPTPYHLATAPMQN